MHLATHTSDSETTPGVRGQRRPLSSSERSELLRIVEESQRARLVLRARIVLTLDQGTSLQRAARELGTTVQTVRTWSRRFAAMRLDGLADRPRSGPRRRIPNELVADVIARTLLEMPAHGEPWSTRKLSRLSGTSQSAVSRIWRALALDPRRPESLELLRSTLLVEGRYHVAGLYVSPTDCAIAIWPEEKHELTSLHGSGVRHVRVDVVSSLQARRRSSLFSLTGGRRPKELGAHTGHGTGIYGTLRFRSFLRQLAVQDSPPRSLHVVAAHARSLHAARIRVWHAHHPRIHLHHPADRRGWEGLAELWATGAMEPEDRYGEDRVQPWREAWHAYTREAHTAERFADDTESPPDGTASPFVWLAQPPRLREP